MKPNSIKLLFLNLQKLLWVENNSRLDLYKNVFSNEQKKKLT